MLPASFESEVQIRVYIRQVILASLMHLVSQPPKLWGRTKFLSPCSLYPKMKKIFSRSHISTLYALLRCFSEIYTERLISWSTRHFATLASLEHIISPLRHFARRATLFQIARMHHLAHYILWPNASLGQTNHFDEITENNFLSKFKLPYVNSSPL